MFRRCRLPRAAAVMGVATIVAGSQLQALKAAGLTGTAPIGGHAFQGLINGLYSNMLWLIAISLGLLFIVRIAALMFGSVTAIDGLGKIVVGALFILVGIPAILH